MGVRVLDVAVRRHFGRRQCVCRGPSGLSGRETTSVADQDAAGTERSPRSVTEPSGWVGGDRRQIQIADADLPGWPLIALLSLDALRTIGPRRPLLTVGASRSLNTLDALGPDRSVGSRRSRIALWALLSWCSRVTLDSGRARDALRAGNALRASGSGIPRVALRTLSPR